MRIGLGLGLRVRVRVRVGVRVRVAKTRVANRVSIHKSVSCEKTTKRRLSSRTCSRATGIPRVSGSRGSARTGQGAEISRGLAQG